MFPRVFSDWNGSEIHPKSRKDLTVSHSLCESASPTFMRRNGELNFCRRISSDAPETESVFLREAPYSVSESPPWTNENLQGFSTPSLTSCLISPINNDDFNSSSSEDQFWTPQLDV